ncbi:MAG: DNA-directed RNA polymerase subunit beta [Acidobacteria bacterium]|nr:DNA-directed RNA polymerase subunit beta [Acidobacteriota bacterium]MCW5967387.1 DNA-directed RNA polymerase subunit beta [Blastocatellales bacterium]
MNSGHATGNEKPGNRERYDFSKIRTSVRIPNLIEVQRESYDRFLQMDLLPQERDNIGLQAVFRSTFPISDFRDTSSLEFVEYRIGNWQCKCGDNQGLNHLRSNCRQCGSVIRVDPFSSDDVICRQCGTYNRNVVNPCPNCGEPVGLKHKYDVHECQERGMTYSVPLHVKIRLTVWDKDEDTAQKSIRDIKEEEVYFGDLPLMTDNGTFIINGTERVIVSQLHRSPGVFFEKAENNTYFLAKIIPYRGSWVEFEYDAKNLLYVRIDRKRKFLATIFLRALGLKSDEEILRAFYTVDRITVNKGQLACQVSPNIVGTKASSDILDSDGEVIVKSGRKITQTAYETMMKARIRDIEVRAHELAGAYTASDLASQTTGEVVAECNTELSPEVISKIIEAGIPSFDVFYPERDDIGPVISLTVRKDVIKTSQEALIEIYRKMRPGDPPTLETSTALFQGMFFDPRKFDFSRVGRLKFNIKMGRTERERLDDPLLSPQDFFEVIDYVLKIKRLSTKPDPTITADGRTLTYNDDDIDHLGNRRVRAVGELLENQFRLGLVRMERAIKEKMSIHQEMQTAMPRDLINAKPVTAAVREFFGSSQLSQFMDQTNPLSEITHKRRLSALGPGGLSRERAGFEVRDVHTTHYGRICPIETPEGPNIGLISSLSCFARINEFGFIESPYRKVEHGRVIDYVRILNGGDTEFKPGDHIEESRLERANRKLPEGAKRATYEPFPFYLTAWEEDKYIIGQANIDLDKDGNIIHERVNARQAGEFILAHRDDIQYIDVSPKQLVSVAASLIPFLENDDANRALMGSNMQRQAVPLLRAEAPYIGTGMEKVTAQDSGAVVVARRDGIVDVVDSERIIIRVDHNVDGTLSREVTADIYPLTKFKRSNQNTCINQKPIVKVGQRITKGAVIADGPCTEGGELALGRNVLVAFMPWRGYNFEDAILVSEKLVKDDYYTSIHIEELEIEARDTKLGPEEITRDIPNVGEAALRDLDESGIIRIGAYVKPGSILVGKVTPKGETQLTAEEKLLRAIFGEKAGDVRDASLTCPPGIEGTVVDVKVFTRKGADKDIRSLAIEQGEEDKLRKNLHDEIRILEEERNKRVIENLEDRRLEADLVHNRRTIAEKGAKLTREMLMDLDLAALKKVSVSNARSNVTEEIRDLERRTERQINILRNLYDEKIEKLKKGDELAPGVIKMVKVFIAMKRKLSVGDKMAGRHGNKGVIARILAEEDMPYLPDGTPVEIVLNPLGVPSRMNVGQILETHLGWAGQVLGLRFATPVFDGATESEIKRFLREANDHLLNDRRPSMINESGKTILYDGLTGEAFEQKVTVGYIYMLKLSHLVDDKIHARSIGPYSLITQQPLGGKAQFGGQRFGEMEVWALEAYGAAHILQELLTAKSDDVAGRSKIYEAIVKGESDFEPGLPESFNVLIRELQSLCLDVELRQREKKDD